MSGWKGPHLAIYHLRFLKPPSDWDLILPKRFTVSSGLNVQCHNEADSLKRSTPWGVSLGIFAAEQCDVGLMVVSHWKPSVVMPPSNRRLPNCRGKLVCR